MSYKKEKEDARKMMDFQFELEKTNLSEDEKAYLILSHGCMIKGVTTPKICESYEEMIKDNPWVPEFEKEYEEDCKKRKK